MKIIRDYEACYGCAACEMACSFHHTKAFSHDSSSISVFKDDKTGNIKWQIDSTCDSCKGEEEPLCIKFCRYDALKEVE